MKNVNLDTYSVGGYLRPMLVPEQSRAARGWLDWSQEELAKRSNVSPSTVRNFEKGRNAPIRNNLDAICAALEGAGVRFTYAANGRPAGIAVNDEGKHVPHSAPDRCAK